MQFRGPVVDQRIPVPFAPSLAQCPAEQMLVQVDADQLHVAGLRLADQIARTAQIEIARADRKARA